MSQFIGKNKTSLIKQKGLPNEKVTEDGKLIWMYESFRSRIVSEKSSEIVI